MLFRSYLHLRSCSPLSRFVLYFAFYFASQALIKIVSGYSYSYDLDRLGESLFVAFYLIYCIFLLPSRIILIDSLTGVFAGCCAYIDAENAFSPSFAEAIGVDTERLLIAQPDSAENSLSIVNTLVGGSIDVVVVDSVCYFPLSFSVYLTIRLNSVF